MPPVASDRAADAPRSAIGQAGQLLGEESHATERGFGPAQLVAAVDCQAVCGFVRREAVEALGAEPAGGLVDGDRVPRIPGVRLARDGRICRERTDRWRAARGPQRPARRSRIDDAYETWNCHRRPKFDEHRAGQTTHARGSDPRAIPQCGFNRRRGILSSTQSEMAKAHAAGDSIVDDFCVCGRAQFDARTPSGSGWFRQFSRFSQGPAQTTHVPIATTFALHDRSMTFSMRCNIISLPARRRNSFSIICCFVIVTS